MARILLELFYGQGDPRYFAGILSSDRGSVKVEDGNRSQTIQKGCKIMGIHHMISRPIILKVVEE